MTKRTVRDYLDSGDCPETDEEMYEAIDAEAVIHDDAWRERLQRRQEARSAHFWNGAQATERELAN